MTPAGDSRGCGSRSVAVRRGAGAAVVPAGTCASTSAAGSLLDAGLLSDMSLIMLGQVGFLAEALAAERAGERLLAGVRPDVHVYAVLVLEALAADAAVVQRAFLALNTTWGAARASLLLTAGIAASLGAGVTVAGAVGVVIVAIAAPAVFFRRFGDTYSS